MYHQVFGYNDFDSNAKQFCFNFEESEDNLQMESKISEFFTSMYFVDDDNKISDFIVNMIVLILKNFFFISSTQSEKISTYF